MNEVLSQFVAETEVQFAGRLRKPEELFRRESTSEELLDIAVLSGYSVSDILAGKVSESDIDPRVLEAFVRQYPHVGHFVDFIQSHEGDPEAINGIVSAVKGKLFEFEYLEWLNDGHLPSGAIAELASSPTQPVWDIIIKDTQGHPIEYLQLKATESIGYIKHAFETHPDIDVVTTHEVFGRIEDMDGSQLREHVVDGNFFNEHLEGHVRDGVTAAEMSPEFAVPYLAFATIAIQSLKSYFGGKQSGKEAARSGLKRGWRTLLCRAASYAVIFISNEPVLGLPTSVLTRLTLGRKDVQKQGLDLLHGLTTGLLDKHKALSAAM